MAGSRNRRGAWSAPLTWDNSVHSQSATSSRPGFTYRVPGRFVRFGLGNDRSYRKSYKRGCQETFFRARRSTRVFSCIQPPCAVLTVLARRAAARRFDSPIPRVSCSRLRRHHSFPETDKRDGCQVGNHGPIGDLWPIAFLGCSRGHRVPQRLVRKAQGPNLEPVRPLRLFYRGSPRDGEVAVIAALAQTMKLDRHNLVNVSNRRSLAGASLAAETGAT